jgi:hypothetical protein
MTFDTGPEWIHTTAIAPAVQKAGYEPLILSRQDHPDRVDERIVLELNRSRFVVGEFAQHRPSVYFEAVYAVGRGLPVILDVSSGGLRSRPLRYPPVQPHRVAIGRRAARSALHPHRGLRPLIAPRSHPSWPTA